TSTLVPYTTLFRSLHEGYSLIRDPRVAPFRFAISTGRGLLYVSPDFIQKMGTYLLFTSSALTLPAMLLIRASFSGLRTQMHRPARSRAELRYCGALGIQS